MFVNSRDRTAADPRFAEALNGTGVDARWLVGGELGGAVGGKIGSVIIAAGGSASFVSAADVEQALFALSGDGTTTFAGAAMPTATGDTVYIPDGHRVTINAASDLRLLLIHRGSPRADDFGNFAGGARMDAAVRSVSLQQVRNAPVHNPAQGFLNMAARWLVNAETMHSEKLIVGQSTFQPGAAHLLHRHDRAEEFFYIVDGGGHHLVEGDEVAITPGDIVFTARNEWHGFRNSHQAPARAVFGYFGAAHLDDGGYEVHPDAAAGTESAFEQP